MDSYKLFKMGLFPPLHPLFPPFSLHLFLESISAISSSSSSLSLSLLILPFLCPHLLPLLPISFPLVPFSPLFHKQIFLITVWPLYLKCTPLPSDEQKSQPYLFQPFAFFPPFALAVTAWGLIARPKGKSCLGFMIKGREGKRETEIRAIHSSCL